VPVDIFDTNDLSATDRVFRYPLYERWLWLVVVVVGILALVFLRQLREFVANEGRRAWIVLGAVGLLLLLSVWISLRAWLSKVVLSPVSLKATVFGQGVQRISWIHIQRVLYRWRPLGHRLIFVGSDGAKVSFRSTINGYDDLMAFIRESAPDHVVEQLDEIFGEEAFEEEEGEIHEDEEEEEEPRHNDEAPEQPQDEEPGEPRPQTGENQAEDRNGSPRDR